MTETIIFYMLTAVILLSALGVVLLPGLMHSALCLGLCLAGVAGIFASLGSDFVFAAQILVYVGGIAVLILFVVLLAGSASDKIVRQVNDQWLPSLLICAAFFWAFLKIMGYFSGIPGAAAPSPSVRAIAALMLGDYAVPFELISVVLLASMTGAVLFGRRKAQ
ncbi:MAG: NADH-quinone oxidoreductase subunit J [Elusimicrobiales bacterium]|nr:NADH-quinone oxidoreductase subunit J [Elusimicrobiales bacterium]